MWLPLCSQFHFLLHSYGNRGQEMRGFSRSMWNLAFCVATAQAAATEARGEIEFSWNSPVSLALGWTVLDYTGLALVQGAGSRAVFRQSSWCWKDVGLVRLRLSQGWRELCHLQLVIKIWLEQIPQRIWRCQYLACCTSITVPNLNLAVPRTLIL